MSCTRTFGYWGRDLNDDPGQMTWLWDGYLAPGQVTLLTSQSKSGKTTLLSILLQRLKQGGLLAERPLAAASAVVVSEEPREQWRSRRGKLDFDHVYFITQPFPGKPTMQDWTDLLDFIAGLHAQQPVG